MRIRQLLQERDCCHGSCFTLDLHRCKLCLDFHPHLHRQLCEALTLYNPRSTSIHQCISSILSSIFIKWVPGNSNIPGDGLADRAVKEATTVDTIHSTPHILCDFQVINNLFHDDPPSHACTNEIYQHHKTVTDQQQVQNHRDDVLIAQLHSGHHLLLKAHQHRTDPEIDLMCPSCKQAECTLQHWLIECPAGDAIWQHVFGNRQGSLKWLAIWPRDVIAFTRKTLVDLDA